MYFTSESHIHGLLNVLRFFKNKNESCLSKDGLKYLDNCNECDYLTHIVIKLYYYKYILDSKIDQFQ